MSIMIVTGAFATHTTKLYNYYVCPCNWQVENLTHIGVNYFGELNYLGRINHGPLEWSYNESTNRINYGSDINYMPAEVKNDLEQFKTLLNNGNHYLFLLSPILGGCTYESLRYSGNGAFTRSHRYFPSIGDMLAIHQGITELPNSGTNIEDKSTSKID